MTHSHSQSLIQFFQWAIFETEWVSQCLSIGIDEDHKHSYTFDDCVLRWLTPHVGHTCMPYMGRQFSCGAGSSGFALLTFSLCLSRSSCLRSTGALGDESAPGTEEGWSVPGFPSWSQCRRTWGRPSMSPWTSFSALLDSAFHVSVHRKAAASGCAHHPSWVHGLPIWPVLASVGYTKWEGWLEKNFCIRNLVLPLDSHSASFVDMLCGSDWAVWRVYNTLRAVSQ